MFLFASGENEFDPNADSWLEIADFATGADFHAGDGQSDFQVEDGTFGKGRNPVDKHAGGAQVGRFDVENFIVALAGYGDFADEDVYWGRQREGDADWDCKVDCKLENVETIPSADFGYSRGNSVCKRRLCANHRLAH